MTFFRQHKRLALRPLILASLACLLSSLPAQAGSSGGSRFHLMFGLNPQYLQYEDAYRDVQVKNVSLVAKADAGLFIIRNFFEAQAGLNYTFSRLNNMGVSTMTPKFLEYNWRFPLWLSAPKNRLSLALAPGWYQFSATATGGTIGLTNMSGPEMYVFLGYTTKAKKTLLAQLRFFSIASGWSDISASKGDYQLNLSYPLRNPQKRIRIDLFGEGSYGKYITSASGDFVQIKTFSGGLLFGF